MFHRIWTIAMNTVGRATHPGSRPHGIESAFFLCRIDVFVNHKVARQNVTPFVKTVKMAGLVDGIPAGIKIDVEHECTTVISIQYFRLTGAV